MNGFDVNNGLITVELILPCGPERNGIPAIDAAHFISNKEVDFLQQQDRVLGLELQGAARAYPASILNYHEIVDDHIGDQALKVTLCPLCVSGMVFVADINNRRMRFGVSGLLYNSAMLLYDRAINSMWSQLMKQAISGLQKGDTAEMLALQ
jgi:hypothetical protein